MAKAYAYVRCAHVPQDGLADSLCRQLELSKRYADENGMELVETVQDAGVGGYRNHTDRTALASLLEQIETGAVEPGSYLLIQSLDRLSQDSGIAIKLLAWIIKRGVKVVTYDDGVDFRQRLIEKAFAGLLKSARAGQ